MTKKEVKNMIEVFDSCGLLRQLDEKVNHEVTFFLPKGLSANNRRYAEAWEDTYKKVFSQTDWEEFFDENEIPELDETIKEGIKETLDRTELWIWFYTQIWLLYCYFLEQELDTTFIEDYFNFMQSELGKRNLKIPTYFQENPLDKIKRLEQRTQTIRAMNKQREQEIAERFCPYCGSQGKDIISWSKWRYRCNACGKTFKKP
jgi:rRNA maturation endonuclease Nob1